MTKLFKQVGVSSELVTKLFERVGVSSKWVTKSFEQMLTVINGILLKNRKLLEYVFLCAVTHI